MKQKKGFVLAYTLVVMVMVFALTSVLLAVISTQNVQAKKSATNFQNRVAICQIANHFAGQNTENFVLQYEDMGFKKSVESEKIVLQKEDFEYSIFLNENGINSTLLVVQKQKNTIVATVEKSGENVVVWSYEIKENQ